jgi:hypothetical protein
MPARTSTRPAATPRVARPAAVPVPVRAQTPARRPGAAVAVRPRYVPTRRPVVRYRRRSAWLTPGQQKAAAIAGGVLALLAIGGRHDEAAPAAAAPAVTATAPTAATTCTVAGVPTAAIGPFSGRQLEVAAAIVAVGREMGVPEAGQVVAVATAMQESKLRVYANPAVPESMSLPHEAVGTDHRSVGPFQQQPWWGPIPALMDPRGSARAFYRVLLTIPGWDRLPLTRAAQAVQRSAFPDRYAAWADLARQVVAAAQVGITCETRN